MLYKEEAQYLRDYLLLKGYCMFASRTYYFDVKNRYIYGLLNHSVEQKHGEGESNPSSFKEFFPSSNILIVFSILPMRREHVL